MEQQIEVQKQEYADLREERSKGLAELRNISDKTAECLKEKERECAQHLDDLDNFKTELDRAQQLHRSALDQVGPFTDISKKTLDKVSLLFDICPH